MDLSRDVVLVHEEPAGGEYTGVREYAAGDSWDSPALGDRRIRGTDVFGPGPAA